jgi:mannose-1-phosphate guanylyltransferase/mannose-1-phosphate guanylyltransferase/mannose-6-phosphate isomerase
LSDIPVAVCGCEDLIIVIRSAGEGLKPVALIAKKGETQKIRNIVEQIKEQDIEGLL